MKFFRRKELRSVWADESRMPLEYGGIWESDLVLQRFYKDLWDMTMSAVTGAPVIELGGGGGFIRQYYPDVITSDLNRFPCTQLVCNATRLPFRAGSVGSLIAVAFFHHCVNPKQLFDEVQRVLKPSGRFVIFDPYISLLSRLVYALGTEEDCDLSQPPFETAPGKARIPLLEANIAKATIIFKKNRPLFEKLYPSLRIVSVDRVNLLRHIIAGSCLQKSPFPAWLYPVAGWVDRALNPMSKFTAISVRVVLEKTEV